MKNEISEKMWEEIKTDAKARRICFAITKDEAWRIFLAQDGCCAITGVLLDFDSQGYRGTASLDRINSFAAYSPHNVQWIFAPINVMKRNHNPKYFKQLCELVVNPKVGKRFSAV